MSAESQLEAPAESTFVTVRGFGAGSGRGGQERGGAEQSRAGAGQGGAEAGGGGRSRTEQRKRCASHEQTREGHGSLILSFTARKRRASARQGARTGPGRGTAA